MRRLLALLVALTVMAPAAMAPAPAMAASRYVSVSGIVAGGRIVTVRFVNPPSGKKCFWGMYSGADLRAKEIPGQSTLPLFGRVIQSNFANLSCSATWKVRLPASSTGQWVFAVFDYYYSDGSWGSWLAAKTVHGPVGKTGRIYSTVPMVHLSCPRRAVVGETIRGRLSSLTHLATPTRNRWMVFGDDPLRYTVSRDKRSVTTKLGRAEIVSIQWFTLIRGYPVFACNVDVAPATLVSTVPTAVTTGVPFTVSVAALGTAGTATYKWYVGSTLKITGRSGSLSLPEGTATLKIVVTSTAGLSVSKSISVTAAAPAPTPTPTPAP